MDTLTVLYGSQTGNAEDLAKRIGQMGLSKGYRVLVKTIDDFPVRCLAQKNMIIFVCSTTGHGQEPENMSKFFNFIRRRDLPQGCLSNLNFAVFGLGDSSYTKFNYVSKIVFNRLKYLGGIDLIPLTAGDEQHQLGCDGLIYPSLDQLWAILKINNERLQNHLTSVSVGYNVSRNAYEVTYLDEKSQNAKDIYKDDFISKHNIIKGICVANERVTPDSHFQDTRFFRFKTIDQINYEPGDVCAIYPCNSDENVDLFIKALRLDPDHIFRLTKKVPGYMVNYLYDFIPDGLSIRQLVKHYLDIQAIPKRSFFEFLWPISKDDLEKTKLKEFSSTECQNELYEYCIQPRRTALEVLLDFPNTRECIQLEHLFDIIPPIKPRSFSIASSLCKHPNEIQLIVGVVNYKTRLRKIRMGLCSNFLASLMPVDLDKFMDSDPDSVGSSIRFKIHRSSFKLPTSPLRPIVMIGPGLGIAPMRSFIEARDALCSKSSSNLLYFGCRFRDRDFYFNQELSYYEDKGLLNLRVAFSREEEKQYVQDLIEKDCDLIRELVEEQDAVIYVAGNSKLPEDLRIVLHKILIFEHGDSELVKDQEMIKIKQLESSGRIQYDCW